MAFILLLGSAQAAESSSWLQSEQAAREVQKQILSPWKKAWRDRDARAYSALFTETASQPDWEGKRRLRREEDGVREYDVTQSPGRASSRAALNKEAEKYLKAFSRIEDVELTVVDVETLSPRIVARVRFDLRGTRGGERRTDRGLLTVEAVRVAGALRLTKVAGASMESLTAAKPAFEDETHAAGLDRIPLYAREEAIRRGGYALAVADYAADGKPGLYVGGRGAGALFRNNGDGTFRDITAASGLGKDELVKAAVFADVDNDGRIDLVLQRFVDDSGDELVFYRNEGAARFKRVAAVVDRRSKHDRPMSMAASDFNGDGRIDLFVGYPGVRDFTDDWIDNQPQIEHQALYVNKGNWRFAEQPNAARAPSMTEPIRAHSIIGMDANQDGREDLLIVDDRGGISPFFLNLGDGRFEESAQKSGLNNRSWGMTAAAGDYAGKGRSGIYFTNIDFSAGRRALKEIERSGSARSAGYERFKELEQGNRLYQPKPIGAGEFSYAEATDKAGLGWAGEAPAGAAWIDYNNDGRLDLYVANGLWSADADCDYSEEFVEKMLARAPGAEAKPNETNETMRRLQKSGCSFAGHQRNRLFRNNGDETFTEVGYLAGADRIEDGYVAAVADIDADGRADLILRNTDPASLSHTFLPVTVLRNVTKNKNRSLAVYLKGDGGASSDIGARVVMRAGDKTQTREIRAVEGAVQSEPMALFGLGDGVKADAIEVRWLSGAVDRFENVPAGRLTVKEGDGKFALRETKRVSDTR